MQLDDHAFRKILDNLYDGVYIVDRDRVIRYWNGAAEAITGFSAAEVVGRSCSDNILTHVDADGANLCTGMCPLAEAIAEGEAREAEVYLHHRRGHRVPVSVRINPLTDGGNNIVGAVELFTDISSYKSNELRVRELEEMAYLDQLTTLANRNRIEQEFRVRFEEQKRYGLSFGVLMMDIDHFKRFNDTYGHDVGDQVLRYVAQTLVSNTRPFDSIGRWGGEEFIGIMRHVTLEQLGDLGERLRRLVANSYTVLNGEKLYVTISVGGTLLHPDDTVDTLLRRADALLYESKRAGRNRLTTR